MEKSQLEIYVKLNFIPNETEFETFGSHKTVIFRSIYYIHDDGRVFCHATDNSDYCIRNHKGIWVNSLTKQ